LPQVLVYPAHPETFQEILAAPSMFTDHFPHHYLLKTLAVPKRWQPKHSQG
jgi:hypothetical protein